MKKKTILIVLFVVMTIFTVAAQIADIPKSYLRFSISGDLFKIYPEADYISNPAFILDMKKTTYFNNLYLTMYSPSWNEDYQNSLSDPGPGAADGTRDRRYSSKTINPSVTAFFPSEKKVLGVYGYFNYYDYYGSDQYLNYNANPEDYIDESSEMTISGAGDVYYAVNMDNLRVGVKGGAYYSADPYGTTTRTTSGTPDITALYDNTDSRTLSPRGSAGILLKLDDAQLGAGVDFYYSTTVNTPFVLQADDSIITAEEDTRNTTSNPDYSTNDSETVMDGDLSLSYISPVSNTMKFIATGKVDFFNNNTTSSYTRTAAADLNDNTTTKAENGFDFTAGVEISPHKTLRLRLGAGGGLALINQTVNNVDAAGVSTFDPANEFHYPEVNWANQPNNDVVSGVVSTNNDSYAENTLTLRGLLGAEWMPAPTVVLFNSATITHKMRTVHKAVFNRNDNTVWTEDEPSIDSDFDLNLNLGAGFIMSEDTYLGFGANINPLSISFDSNGDVLPQQDGTVSTGGQGGQADLYESNYNDFTLNLFFILGL